MTPTIIKAIARICETLHLDMSKAEMIASLISDLVKGFALQLPQTHENWQSTASAEFARAMCALNPDSWDLEGYLNMQWAFLDGCRWAQGDFNARQKPKQMATMFSRAQRTGLESPLDILAAELNTAKTSICKYEKKQQDMLQGSASRALLSEPDDDNADAIIGTNHAEEAIAIDSDSGSEYNEDDKSDDGNSSDGDVSLYEL